MYPELDLWLFVLYYHHQDVLSDKRKVSDILDGYMGISSVSLTN